MRHRLLIVPLTIAALCIVGGPAAAQTTPAPPAAPIFIGKTCTFSWSPNSETDLAGYRAWVSEGTVTKPTVTIQKTEASHPTSVPCSALGVTTDGLKRFHVVAFDSAGNVSLPAFIEVTRDTTAPKQPSGLTVTRNP